MAVFFFKDIGAGKGKYYAVNFPLRDGIDDESYEQIFKPVSMIKKKPVPLQILILLTFFIQFRKKSWKYPVNLIVNGLGKVLKRLKFKLKNPWGTLK